MHSTILKVQSNPVLESVKDPRYLLYQIEVAQLLRWSKPYIPEVHAKFDGINVATRPIQMQQ